MKWHNLGPGRVQLRLCVAVFGTVMAGIALTDARHYLIPDGFTVFGLLWVLSTALVTTALALLLRPGGVLGFEHADRSEETLRDHLLWQLELENLDARTTAIGQAIIDAIKAVIKDFVYEQVAKDDRINTKFFSNTDLPKLEEHLVNQVCEATGGYERRLLEQLHQAGVPVCRLQPGRVRLSCRRTRAPSRRWHPTPARKFQGTA